MKIEQPSDVARRVEGEEPQGDERERAVRAHVERVAKLSAARLGSTPSEIERILNMPHPECTCEEPKVKAAHGTFICAQCGGICVGSFKSATRVVEEDPKPERFEKDTLGRHPVVFNKSTGEPIRCLRCEAEGKLVYAGYAPNERKIFCPTGRHTKIPREARFTSRLMRRRAKA